jgi:acyl-CoA thioester hydrolase
MENGRLRLLEAMGLPVSEIADKAGIVPVLTETWIAYKRPLFLHNEANVEIWISELNNASAIMEFRFYNETGELCAKGRQTGLFVDRTTMRPVRLTGTAREAFERFMGELDKS